MDKPRDVGIELPDEAVEEAPSDHHLDEVAEMIERTRADKPAPETPFSDSPAGSNHRS